MTYNGVLHGNAVAPDDQHASNNPGQSGSIDSDAPPTRIGGKQTSPKNLWPRSNCLFCEYLEPALVPP
ncbi:hypothetical protein DPEC_G00079850 [Dallia pectoralis]|uniref:Uncharacterized protein n=1 Tax=Dallia pectoralis TaxID=75939 RepID=A0ACC2H4R7_DALPE|nr:hypothetical protein DPEC_G00079850 [Dallia pectoralis]